MTEKLTARESAAVYAARNKHKGDVMERREWTYKYLRGQGYLIGEAGRGCIATVADEPTAKSVCDDHNQHTTFVEQRDLLAAVARAVVKKYEGNFAVPFDEAELLDMAMNALATVEQGHEEQAGGGSEGEG